MWCKRRLSLPTSQIRLSNALAAELDRGVTRWRVEGQQNRNVHAALYCTISRPQVSTLKNIVAAVDDKAFMIISSFSQKYA